MKPKSSSIHTRILEYLTALPYSTLFLLWILLAVLFGCGYFLFSSIGDVSHHGPAALVAQPNIWYRLLDSMYYSIITATSTGYGDITPQGLSKLLAALQSMSALFVFALFVTKLVSHRQEQAMREVHRMSFEDVFHNLREGLYILRKDFDHLIEKAKAHQKFDAEDWDTLIIAYKQAQSLIAEIPDFYSEESELYIIDQRREQLIQEAIHRTLHRINQMLDVFSQNNITWLSNQDSLQELNELVTVVNRITPLWQEKSPYQSREAFSDILSLIKQINKSVNQCQQ